MKSLNYLVLAALIICVFCGLTMSSLNAEPSGKNDQKTMQSGEMKHRGMGSGDGESMQMGSHSENRDYYMHYNTLKQALIMHYQKTGEFPATMKELVTSGDCLLWPKNKLTGEPAKCVTKLPEPSKETLGFFTYEKLAKDKAKLTYVGFDERGSKESGVDKWIIGEIAIPREPHPQMDASAGSELTYIHILCGRKQISEISDVNQRQLYILSGQLANYLGPNLSHSYTVEDGQIPCDVKDLIDNSNFIIKENYQKLTTLMGESKAEYRCGIDESKLTAYADMKIDGDEFIGYCSDFSEGGFSSIGKECDIKNLDTSSPILTSASLSSLESIPGLMISIEDIF